jgi:hypothetical protein
MLKIHQNMFYNIFSPAKNGRIFEQTVLTNGKIISRKVQETVQNNQDYEKSIFNHCNAFGS